MSEETETTATPAWMLGTGLETDMKGDPRPGFGSSIRFWIPPGERRKIIWLTEANAMPIIWEHNFQVGGDWRNWCTCTKVLGGECPFCDYSDTHKGRWGRYKAAIATLIDTHEFKVKDKKTGEEVTKSNLKKLFVCKSKTAEILKLKYQNRLEATGNKEGLKYTMFSVYRITGDNSCAVGNDFEYIKSIDPAMITDPKEYNYAELLKPDLDRAKRLLEIALSGAKYAAMEAAAVGSGGIDAVESKAIKY